MIASTSPYTAVNQPDVLHRILDSGVNFCLWQRLAQPAVIRELSFLQASDLPDVRCPTSLDSFDDEVSRLLLQKNLDPLALKN